MALLTLDQIKAADDRKTEVVEVPEWGGSVIVRAMSGAERDKWEESIFDMKGKKMIRKFDNFRAKLVVKSCVDEDGNLIFTEKDLGWLGSKSAAALDKVASVAQRLSAITKEDVEELEKNLEGDQSEGSTSD